MPLSKAPLSAAGAPLQPTASCYFGTIDQPGLALSLAAVASPCKRRPPRRTVEQGSAQTTAQQSGGWLAPGLCGSSRRVATLAPGRGPRCKAWSSRALSLAASIPFVACAVNGGGHLANCPEPCSLRVGTSRGRPICATTGTPFLLPVQNAHRRGRLHYTDELLLRAATGPTTFKESPWN